jgi:hypothetical protein
MTSNKTNCFLGRKEKTWKLVCPLLTNCIVCCMNLTLDLCPSLTLPPNLCWRCRFEFGPPKQSLMEQFFCLVLLLNMVVLPSAQPLEFCDEDTSKLPIGFRQGWDVLNASLLLNATCVVCQAATGGCCEACKDIIAAANNRDKVFLSCG